MGSDNEVMSEEATVNTCPKPYIITDEGLSIVDHDATFADYVGGRFVRLSPRFIETIVSTYLREHDGRAPEQP